jgi:putative transposase
MPAKVAHDMPLMMKRSGEWYLAIPVAVQPRSESQAPVFASPLDGTVALDPEVRTFQTCFDGRGRVFKWGHGDMGRIVRLRHHLDKLISRLSQPAVPHRRRWRMRRAARRMRLRIRRLVDDLHRRLAKWLCESYTRVLLPEFRSSQMVLRESRQIRRSTVRSMLTWGHYRFRQHLLHKAREFPWCQVVICDEAYTTKTCGKCGERNERVGGSKVFRCPRPECRFRIDRDVNGARNIGIRYLTLQHEREQRVQQQLRQQQQPVQLGSTHLV